jgi:hypothetical protein
MFGYHRHNAAEHRPFRWMTFDRTFFITTVTWQLTPLFHNPQKAEFDDRCAGALWRTEEIRYARVRDHARSSASALTPAADISLERAVQLIKGGFSYRLGKVVSANASADWSGRKASRTIGFATSGTTRNTETTFA